MSTARGANTEAQSCSSGSNQHTERPGKELGGQRKCLCGSALKETDQNTAGWFTEAGTGRMEDLHQDMTPLHFERRRRRPL